MRMKNSERDNELQKYRHIADVASEGLWYDPVGTESPWFSRSWRAMLGYHDEPMPADFNKWKDWVHPDDQDVVDQALEKLFRGGRTTLDCKYRIRHRNGKYKKVHSYGRIVNDSDGRLLALVGFDVDITNRERRDEFLNEMLDMIPSLLFIKDKNGSFTYANRAVADAFGASVDGILGRKDGNFNKNEAQVRRFRKADLKVLRTRLPLRIQQENLDFADGNTHQLATIKVPVSASAAIGEVEVFGVATDITALRQEIEKERQLFQNLMDNVPDGVFFKDRKSRFIRANKALANLVGEEDPEDLFLKSDEDYFSKEYAATWRKEEQHILRTGQSIVNDIRMVRPKHGMPSWRSVTKIPIWDKGRVVQIVGISRDVTDLKNTANELEKSNTLLEQILDNVPECIWLKDKTCVYQKCNKSFLERYDYTDKTKVIGKTDLQRWTELADAQTAIPAGFFLRQAKKYMADDRAVMRSGIARKDYPEIQYRIDGKPRHLRTSKIPLSIAGGKTSLLGIYRDTTLDENRRLKEHIATGIAENIRNWVQILEHDVWSISRSAPAWAEKAIRKLRSHMRELSKATHMVTNFAHLKDMEFGEVRLEDVVKSVIRDVGNPNVRLVVGKRQPLCHGSEVHLRNVIFEMLRNARDFTSLLKHPRITVSIEPRRSACVLHFINNGPPVPSWLQRLLFEPCVKRLDQSRPGLGLAYVAAVIEAHGGRPALRSSSLRHTHFALTFPCRYENHP